MPAAGAPLSARSPGRAQLTVPVRPESSSLSLSGRPFQRTVTMHRDSTGHVGFVIKKGKVVSVVRGSSAARNGLLTNHYVCEVNGQNVIGLKVGQRPALPQSYKGRRLPGGGRAHVCGHHPSSFLHPKVAARSR